MNEHALLFLHGALGEQHQFDSLKAKLSNRFRIHCLDFEGHGSAKDGGRPFRIEYFSENVLSYMDAQGIEVSNIFGYSMGGYVALYLAKEEPERINRLATLGTVMDWNEEKAISETVYLHPDKMEEKVPHFTKLLEKRHKEDWKTVVHKTRDLLEHLGRKPAIKKEDWRKLTLPVRIHVGDRDNTAGIESALQVYNRLDNGELAVLPRTPHPFEKVKEKWLIDSFTEFFSEEELDARAF